LTVKEAVGTSGATTRMVYQWVEAGRLHFSEMKGTR
jgi:hypothetical protein